MNKLPMVEKTKTRAAWLDAITWVASGNVPSDMLMTNKKTEYSLFDNVPQITCFASCPVAEKCYDVHLMKLRPAVFTARARRHAFMVREPATYVEHAVAEINLLRLKKGLSKVRIYTGGDFNPSQMPLMREVFKALPSVTFYMISKMIRNFPDCAAELLTYENFFLNLSEMADFVFGPEWDSFRAHPRVNSVYTLMPGETDLTLAAKADIVFNVSKRKKDIELYKEAGLALCPCDAKDIPAAGACAACGLCATKGGVAWNK